jgi:hypothetical protein
MDTRGNIQGEDIIADSRVTFSRLGCLFTACTTAVPLELDEAAWEGGCAGLPFFLRTSRVDRVIVRLLVTEH